MEGGKLVARFTVFGNKLLYKGRMVVAKTFAFIPLLLREYHDSRTGGQSGEVKTYPSRRMVLARDAKGGS